MKSISSAESNENIIGGVLTAATQNATHTGDIARAMSLVVTKRMVLGMAAAFDPLQADHAEFALIIPEKVEAFSNTGMAILRQSGQAGRQLVDLASDEVMTTACAAMEMAGCLSPTALAIAQSRYVRAWFSRAGSSFIALGVLALATQAATMAPIREAVVANAERFDR